MPNWNCVNAKGFGQLCWIKINFVLIKNHFLIFFIKIFCWLVEIGFTYLFVCVCVKEKERERERECDYVKILTQHFSD